MPIVNLLNGNETNSISGFESWTKNIGSFLSEEVKIEKSTRVRRESKSTDRKKFDGIVRSREGRGVGDFCV